MRHASTSRPFSRMGTPECQPQGLVIIEERPRHLRRPDKSATGKHRNGAGSRASLESQARARPLGRRLEVLRAVDGAVRALAQPVELLEGLGSAAWAKGNTI